MQLPKLTRHQNALFSAIVTYRLTYKTDPSAGDMAEYLGHTNEQAVMKHANNLQDMGLLLVVEDDLKDRLLCLPSYDGAATRCPRRAEVMAAEAIRAHAPVRYAKAVSECGSSDQEYLQNKLLKGNPLAQFLYANAMFVCEHLTTVFADQEGFEAASDKAEWAMSSLSKYLLNQQKIEFPYGSIGETLPKIVLNSHEKLLGFLKALFLLYRGEATQFIKIHCAFPAPTQNS